MNLNLRNFAIDNRDFVSGTMAGFAAKIVDHPLDTVKVLLQTQDTSTNGKIRYRGAVHCLVDTWKSKGIRGLYKGISSPLIGSMAENALLFWAYNIFKKALGETQGNELPLGKLALAGGLAGAVVPFVNTPVELIKCRLQVQNSASGNFRYYKGPVDVIIKTLKTEGLVKGLYRGNMSTLLREIPGNCVWYGVYEGFCKYMTPVDKKKADLGPSVHLMGGALAGFGYWTAFYPADTVKSMIQTSSDHTKKGFFETLAQIYNHQGLRGLYRGWGVTVTRAAPSHALLLAVYEHTMKLLQPSSPELGGGSDVNVSRHNTRFVS